MLLYCTNADPYSHRCRMVFAEKGITVEMITVDLNNKPQDLLELNPYNTVPTLVERDLVLYESSLIMEFIDERYPHPPLMPVYPVARAKARLMLHRIEKDWYSLMNAIALAPTDDALAKRHELRDSLTTIAPVCREMPFFLSEEFSLMDISLSALLWRLPALAIELPAAAKPLVEYGRRLFDREAFQKSLTEAERGLGGF